MAGASATPCRSPDRIAGLPSVLVATEREQSIPRVAALPGRPAREVTSWSRRERRGAGPAGLGAVPGRVRIVEAAPARHERPPQGRGPIARLKRATWRPPPTAEEELAVAILTRGRGAARRRTAPPDVVALDAPAAVIVSGLDSRRVRLAAGSLRWLADRWDAEAGATPVVRAVGAAVRATRSRYGTTAVSQL